MPLPKLKIKTDKNTCRFLGNFLLDHAEQIPPKGMELEFLICMEVLEKHYAKLTNPRDTKLSLSFGHALAVSRLLQHTPLYTGIDDVIRNDILNQIQKQIKWR